MTADSFVKACYRLTRKIKKIINNTVDYVQIGKK